MMLNVAAEQTDNELLLQRHFTALLSSVWRVKSRTQCRQDLPSSRNGFYFGGRFFSPFNHTKEPPAHRIKFTNLGQNRKLLFAALNEASCSSQEDRVSHSGPREDSLVITEQLDVTLEFPRELNDSITPFPPAINLPVYGSDSQTSVNKVPGEDNHLKVTQDVAESRFRYG